ncbi:EEF1A lysine methyltransferase 4 isoform X2 [Pipra filicauda]|uniref:EEF1A lysine methyltransferase 4 isoform X2 n=1 Tax=Pipra filicauda TaxID=649802 RepID=A0A7R5KAK0_9PASS|nr:EEF1A lysine methyltransferase 4 isoform X2 [Pipra filicauda]
MPAAAPRPPDLPPCRSLFPPGALSAAHPARAGSRTWGRGWHVAPGAPAPLPGMERRRRAPAANPRYGRRRFWDALYQREGAETREWLGGLSRFLPQLEPELRPGDRILVLDASFDVVLEKGTLDVLVVEETDPWDVSPQAAASMRRVLAEVSRVLRPGGCFLSITFAQPHFRKPHYAQEAFGWSLRHTACGDGDAGAFHYFLYIMRKGQPLDPRDVALGRRLHQPLPPPVLPPPPAPPDDDEDYLLAIQL